MTHSTLASIGRARTVRRTGTPDVQQMCANSPRWAAARLIVAACSPRRPTSRIRAAGALVLGGAAAVARRRGRAAGRWLRSAGVLRRRRRRAPGAAGCDRARSGLGATGVGQPVGATEYGGPGDPSSGTVGASGTSLLAHPDSYAELGGVTFQTASAMGGLPYMTPLRVTWDGRSAVAYKRDFGLGGGPVAGLPRVIDLWWQFAGGAADPVPGRPVVRSGADRAARPRPARAACWPRRPRRSATPPHAGRHRRRPRERAPRR